jgi:hypothetical protein
MVKQWVRRGRIKQSGANLKKKRELKYQVKLLLGSSMFQLIAEFSGGPSPARPKMPRDLSRLGEAFRLRYWRVWGLGTNFSAAEFMQ